MVADAAARHIVDAKYDMDIDNSFGGSICVKCGD
jgi:hypothetical protein